MKLNYLTCILLIVLGTTSCSKDKEPTPDAVTTANIIGNVELFNEGTGNGPEAVDNSGMIVKIDGGTAAISTTTDANGEFTLEYVPFGTYSLIYEKTGFGTYKKFNVEHTNSGSSTVITFLPKKLYTYEFYN